MRILLCLLLFPLSLFSASYPFPSQECSFPEIEILSAKKDYKKLLLQNCRLLEKKLLQKIFGQDLAVKQSANAIIRYAAGVHDSHMPIASLLFYGPSGVGKTELVNQICEVLYGDLTNLVRLNMSEYSESHSISRLIGAPPGYIGYQEGGQLSNAILKNPQSIVLLDEVEKAHPQVLKIFLHIFDNGIFTSASGKKVDCRQSMFVMTSNLAAIDICKLYHDGYQMQEIETLVRPIFINVLSPELFNRVDPVLFLPLSKELMDKIVLKQLGEVAARVRQQKQITLSFDQSLVDFLCLHTADPLLGARPLKRLIDKELTTLLAKNILENGYRKNECLLCSYHEGHVIIAIVN